SPDGKRLATGAADRTVRVWDLTTGREAFTLKGHTDSVWGVAFSPDGKRLATASSDRTVKVGDATTNPEALVLDGAMSVACSPDGRLMASGGADESIHIREAAGGPDVLRLNGVAATMAFSPDGKRLATAASAYGSDRAVKVWDTTTGRQTLSLNEQGFEARG